MGPPKEGRFPGEDEPAGMFRPRAVHGGKVVCLPMKPKSQVKARVPTARQGGARLQKTSRHAAAPVRAVAVGRAKAPLARKGKAEGNASTKVSDKTRKEVGREAREDLENARHGYARLYDHAPVGYATLDVKGRIRRINIAGAALLGRTRERLKGLSFASFLAGRKDRELFSGHLEKSRASSDPEESVTDELRLAYRKQDQGRLVQLATRTADRGSDGQLLVVITDLSGPRKIEDSLRGSEERLSAILGAAMDAIISVDEDERIVFFNAAASEMFRWPANEAIGQPLSRLIPERPRSHEKSQVQLRSANGSSPPRRGSLGEIVGVRADGVEIPIEASISHTEVGGTRHATIILRDIGERKRMESEKLFFLRLAEELRLAMTAAGMMKATAAAVGQQMQVARCCFARVDAERNEVTILADHHRPGTRSYKGTHSLKGFTGAAVEELKAGHTVAVEDVNKDRRTIGQRRNYQSQDIRAYVAVPLMREKSMAAILLVTAEAPRAWSASDVSLLSAVAERAWLAAEKLRLDEELRESESRFRTMAEQVPGFVYTTDASGGATYVNQRFLDYTGLPFELAMGEGWTTAVHPQDRGQVLSEWRKALGSGRPFEIPVRLSSAEGRYRWFRNTARPVLDDNGNIINWFGSCADIDDLMRAQAELGAVNERLEERVTERTAQLATANKELHREFMQRQRMEKEMTEISEQERRSLGQDLHDGICQHLTGVAMMADTLSDSCQRKSLLDVSGKVKALADLIRTAANDARNVARGLQPVELDADGLVSALQSLASRHGIPGKVQCRFQCDRPVPMKDNEVATHLYRIAQEAVVNADKHAQARNITVKLGFEEDGMVLSVTDDGRGMPSIQDMAPGPGLRMMRHRASVIGATVAIGPSERGGTVVRCVVPSTRRVAPYTPAASFQP